MTLSWYMTVHIFAVIGILATILAVCFGICVYKIWRYSEIGAVSLEDIE